MFICLLVNLPLIIPFKIIINIGYFLRLGSKHDGDGNDCDPDDHYLMSPTMTNAKIENRDRLSYCSMQQIVNKAADLEW